MSTDAPGAAGATPFEPSHDGSVIDTVQSLIIAFVLAMTFRGFVTEGFVIPTGSMAPTLMGRHLLLQSPQSGFTYPVGLDQVDPRQLDRTVDPMLGLQFPGSGPSGINPNKGRMGDRILVLKCLYPFSEPGRFDVVVFKNPTDPIGDAANYIKRLIGLPNEHVWLTDGDVFARPLEQEGGQFTIQRKPEHVQRAVWQMVHQSDYIPVKPLQLDQHYPGPPWMSDTASWDLTGRSYVCSTDQPTVLKWDNRRMEIRDWASYNMLSQSPHYFQCSDIRVSAGVVANQPGLKTTFEIEARSHVFQFTIQDGTATMRMRHVSGTEWTFSAGPTPVDLPPPGKVFDVEFWHVDQSMQMYINGRKALDSIDYSWTAKERLANSCGGDVNENVDNLLDRATLPVQIRWRFEGSPVTLHRVRLDRDLHYRRDTLDPQPRSQRNLPRIFGPAFGTHPDEDKNPAILKPDQFMMCGDNNSMSLDSRLWGSPHPLVVAQIGDPSPFVVNRKMLLGKAWVVYFPAYFDHYIPDFGRLRFIR